ncbi:Hypothetical predicted protein [Pelobates cultripes]|uniref:Uncharacterized protein n=1 Tax=Pelobates cultripes TaxID=61616 RepID=A0AAD1WIY2_PELCU|nr:Hypothetical predicted protein [Pelobates cultripes]
MCVGIELKPYANLRSTHDLPHTGYLIYLQLQSPLKKIKQTRSSAMPMKTDLSIIDKMCIRTIPKKKVSSVCYDTIIWDTNHPVPKHASERDLGYEIPAADWSRAFKMHQPYTRCISRIKRIRKIAT